jgi:hypothetical protein
VFDVDVFGFLFEDGGGAVIEEGRIGGDDILNGRWGTSRSNMMPYLTFFLTKYPASDFLELKIYRYAKLL